jgi:transcriptional regulator with XRE-family HTH domain
MATMQAVVTHRRQTQGSADRAGVDPGELADKAGIGANTVNRIELNETEPHMSPFVS